jgi:hypothetical protein
MQLFIKQDIVINVFQNLNPKLNEYCHQVDN